QRSPVPRLITSEGKARSPEEREDYNALLAEYTATPSGVFNLAIRRAPPSSIAAVPPLTAPAKPPLPGTALPSPPARRHQCH
ncbi:MAG: hypothetical protein LC126_18645, partial [Bryobacterales bacterium]|nr:hypothetical protein [Bryobacterales bacterium]